MNQMIVKVKTNKVGSLCEVDLGIDEDTWNTMSDEERDEEINLAIQNVLDVWVEAERR